MEYLLLICGRLEKRVADKVRNNKRAGLMNRKVYIIDAKRTAIGKFLGSLYESDPSEVCAQVIRKGFDNSLFKDVDLTIIGNVVSAGTGQGIARKIAIKAGIPEEAPAYSLNMVCGSGMEAVRNGVLEIQCGANLILAGGFEFMSNIPFATNTYMRLGKKFGDFAMTDLMTGFWIPLVVFTWELLLRTSQRSMR